MVVPVLMRAPPRNATDHDRSPPLVTTAADRRTYAWPQLGVELDLPAGFAFLPDAQAVAQFADVYPSVGDQLMGRHWRGRARPRRRASTPRPGWRPILVAVSTDDAPAGELVAGLRVRP